MRLLRIAAATVAVLLLLPGCSLFGGEKELTLEDPTITVFLEIGYTLEERLDIEEAMEALPGVTTVTYVDREAFHQRLVDSVPEGRSLPPEFTVETAWELVEAKIASLEAYRKLQGGDAKARLEAMPGVNEVLFPCAAVSECPASTSPTIGVTA